MQKNKVHYFKRKISISAFIILVTLVYMLVYDFPLFLFSVEHLDMSSSSGIMTFVSVFIAVFVVTSVLLFLFASISISFVRIFALLMMITNSIALYFIMTYHVILDKSMMGNVFTTNSAEALSYYQPKIFIYLFVFGLIPVYLFSKIKIERVKRWRLLLNAVMILGVGVFLMYLNGSTWLWLDKYSKRLGGMSMPWSYMINAVRYQVKQIKKSQKQILLPGMKFKNKDKTIVVLVIGESSRAQNWSLYGYKKETNPSLKTLDVSVLNAVSASTYTTASVHSMLSYTGATSDDYEPLPSYLQRHGADVIWRSNNWGEPPVKVQTYEKKGGIIKSCTGAGCAYDEGLLFNLDKRIDASKKSKIFIVLHTAGSHGPSYYEKYPKAFEYFVPVCKTVDLQKCTDVELRNAYDNTIIYTDHVLTEVIQLLKKYKNTKTMMIYASDHGESLGEHGFYLHGTPYAIAPDEQKRIPFIIWTSENMLDPALRKKIITTYKESFSHKNVFHTVLGAFAVKSTVYNEDNDIFHIR